MTSSLTYPELEPHMSALMGRLRDALPPSIKPGLAVAPVTKGPYCVIYPDSGVIGFTRLSTDRDNLAVQFYVHAVGTGPEQCMWVMDKTRAALLGFRPVVPGRTVTRILQTLGPQMLTSDSTQSLGPIKRDLSTQPPVYVMVAEFAFSSQPGA